MKETKSKLDFKESWHNLKKSWKYAKKQKKRLILYIILSAIVCVLGIITPILSAQMLLKITGGIFKELLVVAAVLLIVRFLTAGLNYISSLIVQIIYFGIVTELQIAVANETLKLKVKELDSNSSGVFVDRLKKDTTDIAEIFTELAYLSTDIFSNIGVLGAIFIINKYLFFYSIITMIILFFVEKIRMREWFEQDEKWRKLNENNTGLITELVRGIRDIKVLNANRTFLNLTEKRLVQSNNQKYKMQNINRKYRFFVTTIREIFLFLFIVLGIILSTNNLLTIANFVIVYMYQERTQWFLNYFVSMIEYFKNFNVSANRVFEIIDSKKYEKETFGDKHIKKVKGNFEFKNVCFAYNKEKPIIKNMSFKIEENETIGFVGKSGGGKTTIFSLLDKLYEIDSGEILIDGKNINLLDQKTIRDNISVITQSPYIFNFTIKENLKLVKPDLTVKEMIKACKIAKLHDFIMTLPNHYDTLVGEGGVTLSGGQRQRLAIARALLKKSEIILFDEATSALDNQTQKDIQNAINHMKGKFTILIIAHRLSTIKDCDKIMVVEKGKIVAEGTHKYLMKNNKLYKKLYDNENIN